MVVDACVEGDTYVYIIDALGLDPFGVTEIPPE